MNKITTEKFCEQNKNYMNKITTEKNHKNSMKNLTYSLHIYEHTNICIFNNNITKKIYEQKKNSKFCIFIYEQITTTQLTTHLN